MEEHKDYEHIFLADPGFFPLKSKFEKVQTLFMFRGLISFLKGDANHNVNITVKQQFLWFDHGDLLPLSLPPPYLSTKIKILVKNYFSSS